jgi:hypothetical protein
MPCSGLSASVVITIRRAGAIDHASWGLDLIRNFASTQGVRAALASDVGQQSRRWSTKLTATAEYHTLCDLEKPL